MLGLIVVLTVFAVVAILAGVPEFADTVTP